MGRPDPELHAPSCGRCRRGRFPRDGADPDRGANGPCREGTGAHPPGVFSGTFRLLIFAALGCLSVLTTARAQGTFVWSNARLPASARVVDCEGKPLGGTNHVVELRVKDPATGRSISGVEQLKDGRGLPLPSLGLLSGQAAGRFGSVTVRVPGVEGGGTVRVQVRVWDRRRGKDYESATVRGEGEVNVRLGGQGSPPAFPGLMTGFPGVRVCPVSR